MAWYQSESLWIQEFADGLAVLQLDPPGKSLRLTSEALAELMSALDAVVAEPRFRVLMIRSAKSGRFAQGPDVPTWKAMRSAGEIDAWSTAGQTLFNRLVRLPIPTIAWVNGLCLGAGLELALACDRIDLVDQPSTQIGFSELDLGLIPSWGSWGPLVRRVGIKKVFPMVLAGRRLRVRDAVAFGLADRVVQSDEPDYDALAATFGKRPQGSWTRRGWGQRVVERFGFGRRLLYRGIERLHRDRLPDDLPAPRAALRVLREFIERGDEAGQRAARSSVVELSRSAAFDNFVRLHELREAAQGAPTAWTPNVAGETIGVVGSTPLAMHLVAAVVEKGGNVVLREKDDGRLGLAIMRLVQSMNSEIQAGRMTPVETKRRLTRIRNANSWEQFSDADLVVDARDLVDVRRCDAEEIDANVPAERPLSVVGLSCRLAETPTERPSRLVGMSLPGPVGMFPVVEWRRHPNTDAGIAGRFRDWLQRLGWTPIEVGDLPGLLLGRLWVPGWNEAIALVREGAAIDAVDRAMVRFGMGRGPFEYLDAYGLDHAGAVVEAARGSLEPRIGIDPFWTSVLERGWRGRVNGRGFYRYGRRRHVNHLLVNWLRAEGPSPGASGGRPRPIPDGNAIRERIVLLTINEAFRALDEGRVAAGPLPPEDTLDLAMMLADWAPHRGGPLHHARQLGLPEIARRLRLLAHLGSRYEPCERLTNAAE